MRRLRHTLASWLGLMVALGALASAPPARAEAPAPLATMVAQMPNVPLGGAGLPMLTYTDLAGAAAAANVSVPAPGDDSGEYLWVINNAFAYGNGRALIDPTWAAVFGFDVTQVDQILEYAAPPDSIVLFRGEFDVGTVRAAWSAAGYTPAASGGYFIAADDYAIDFATDRARLTMASTNVAAILPDGTLAFATTAAQIEGVIAAVTGAGQSFANGLDTPPLLAETPANLTTAVIVGGSALMAMPDPAAVLTPTTDANGLATTIADQRAAAAAMPAVSMVLLGAATGAASGPAGAADPEADSTPTSSASPVAGRPATQAVAVLVLASPAAAETAAATITSRLAAPPDGAPWAERFTGHTVTAIAAEPAVQVVLDLADSTPPMFLLNLMYNRELSFLAWSR